MSDKRPFITPTTEVKLVTQHCARLVVEGDNAIVYYNIDNSLVPHGEEEQSAEFPLVLIFATFLYLPHLFIRIWPKRSSIS